MHIIIHIPHIHMYSMHIHSLKTQMYMYINL